MRDEENLFTWMLRSVATVASRDMLGRESIVCDFMLHFWDNGDVYIMSTNHPVLGDTPEDDVRDLKKWCDDHGWKRLCVNPLLLQDPTSWQFWMRMFISSLVYSKELAGHE